MARKKILCGAIYHEGHSFNPIVTRRDSFDIHFGDDVLVGSRGTNTVTGGIIDAAEACGFDVQVPASFRTLPSGAVDHAVFLEFEHCMVEAAQRADFDAIVLSLHGAMVTTQSDDPEADLMHRLREIVGLDVPMAAGMDLHAHVTPRTLAPCDFLTGFKTNPHADMAQTGRRAFEAVRAMLAGKFRPVCASVHFPMLTLGNDRTDAGPLMGLHQLAVDHVARYKLWDMSIFNVQQFLNVANMGQTVLAYGNGDSAAARTAADDIAQRLWEARADMVGSYPSLEDVLALASQADRQRPVIIGDQGDRVVAGGPGDSTYILQALLRDYAFLPAALPIRDADAVRQCLNCGAGHPITVRVGGKFSKETAPATLSGKIVDCANNKTIRIKGPVEAGVEMASGAYAVIQTGSLMVVLTERPLTFMDPEFYRAFGIEPSRLRIAVARAGYHYTLNYAEIGDCITADTPGMTAYHPQSLPFTVARPFWPLDDLRYEPVKTLTRR